MTIRDLMENHTDLVYHSIAVLAGLAGIGVYIASHAIGLGLVGFISVFIGGGVANARWNPNQ
jgi:hypothetical protein